MRDKEWKYPYDDSGASDCAHDIERVVRREFENYGEAFFDLADRIGRKVYAIVEDELCMVIEDLEPKEEEEEEED